MEITFALSIDPSGGRLTNVTSVCQSMPLATSGDIAVGGVELAGLGVVNLEDIGVSSDSRNDRMTFGGRAEVRRAKARWSSGSRC